VDRRAYASPANKAFAESRVSSEIPLRPRRVLTALYRVYHLAFAESGRFAVRIHRSHVLPGARTRATICVSQSRALSWPNYRSVDQMRDVVRNADDIPCR